MVRAVAEGLTLAALVGAWSVIVGYAVDDEPGPEVQARLIRRLRARRRFGSWAQAFQRTAADVSRLVVAEPLLLRMLNNAQARAPKIAAQVRLDKAARALAAAERGDSPAAAIDASPIWEQAKQRELGRARYEILSLDFYRATYPFWRYTSLLDSATTAGCRALHGLTMPAKDPRWPGYVPPRHWHCRSHIEAVTHSTGMQAALREPLPEHAGDGTFATLLDEWEPVPGHYPPELFALYLEAKGISGPHLELDGPWWRKDADARAR